MIVSSSVSVNRVGGAVPSVGATYTSAPGPVLNQLQATHLPSRDGAAPYSAGSVNKASRYSSGVTRAPLRIACCVLRVACCVLRVACCVSRFLVTGHWSLVTRRHSLLATRYSLLATRYSGRHQQHGAALGREGEVADRAAGDMGLGAAPNVNESLAVGQAVGSGEA